MMPFFIAIAGGLGAVSRFAVDTWLKRLLSHWPLGTIAINVTGSLVLGLITGWSIGHAGFVNWHAVLGTGFLGGYTTFSAASVETMRFLRDKRIFAACLHGGGMLIVSVLAAALGLWLTC